MNSSNSAWRNVRPVLGAIAGLLIPGLPFVASSCSNEQGQGNVFVNPGGNTGTGQGGGGGTSGSAATMGGASISSGGLVITPPPPTPEGGKGGMIEPDASCAKGMTKATLTPVNMFIQFDRSSSMNDDNKWPQAAQALTGFFSDPATAGLGVALRFFPHDLPVAGCTGGNNGACSVDACSQPIVPLGELTKDAAPMDNQENLLVMGVQGATPPMQGGGGGGQGTPLYAALAGALTWARAHRAMAPDDKTVVVLVTDGEPNGCDTDIGHIAQLAADALAQDQILTYAVGIAGASEAQMNQIAMAGGTMHAYFAGNTSTAQQDLIAALNAIRGSTLSCDFPMPTGMNVDPTLVNVNFTPGGGMPEVIGQATDAQNCQSGGWYYDNPAAPTRIFLCPSTCDRAQADSHAQLDIVLGCKAVPVPPPI